MNNKRLLVRSTLAIAVMLGSTTVYSAGFQLNGQSATGLGRAFAGDAVIADNASVIARNPAAMTLFDSPKISFGVIAIDADVKVKNGTYKGLGATSATPFPDEQIGDTSYLPNIYYSHPINEKFTVGLAAYSNFGTKTEFSDNFIANEFGGLTDLKTVNFGLSGAFKINEQLSVGAGIDVITGSGKFIRYNNNIPVVGSQLANVDAEGIGFGWNIGSVYEINDKHRFGLSYRHSPDIKADGNITRITPLTGDLIVSLPDIAEFSGFHQLDEKFAFHYSIQWIEWGAFDRLATTENITLNEYNWKNSWHYSIGATYTLNKKWTLRTGYMFDTSAQDIRKSISVPDSDRQWLSAGFNYKFDKYGSFDVGVTYLIGKDTNVTETSALNTVVNATTRANAWLYGVQYNYSF